MTREASEGGWPGGGGREEGEGEGVGVGGMKGCENGDRGQMVREMVDVVKSRR